MSAEVQAAKALARDAYEKQQEREAKRQAREASRVNPKRK